jgi:hypothetical protein
MHPEDSVSSSRPTGVKIVIAFLSFTIAVDVAYFGLLITVGYVQVQGIIMHLPLIISVLLVLLHPAFSVLLALTIVGLWRMTRWGLWLTIAMSAVGVIIGCYGVVNILNQIHFIMSLPALLRLLNLFFFAFFGPVLLLSSSLIVVYLYKRRRIFLKHVVTTYP